MAQNVAHPHFQNKISLRIKAEVFQALDDYREKQVQKRIQI